jgi:hypothetical protein
MDTAALSHLSREELIERARRLGTSRPELLTRAELRDEIVRRTASDENQKRAARGWFGVARDLVASVVEQGLHLPDAAALIRGEGDLDARYQAPVATVMLAEIYASQGHVARARRMLDEVLNVEPDHEAARTLRDRLGNKPAGETAEGPLEPQPAAGEAGEARASEGEHAEAQAVTNQAEGAQDEDEDAGSGPDTQVFTSQAELDSIASGRSVDSSEVVTLERGRVARAYVGAVSEARTNADLSKGFAPDSADPEPWTVLDSVHEPPPDPWENLDGPMDSLEEPAMTIPSASETPFVPGAPAYGSSATPGAEQPETQAPTAEAVFVSRQGRTLHVYWELSEASEQRARTEHPEGNAAVRVLACSVDGARIRKHEREISIEGRTGGLSLDTGSESAIARVALGWVGESGFLPLAIASEIRLADGEFEWSPHPILAARVPESARARALGWLRSA